MGFCIDYIVGEIFVRIFGNPIINIVLNNKTAILIAGFLMNVFLTFMTVVACIIIAIRLSFIVCYSHAILIDHCKMASLTLFIPIYNWMSIQLFYLLFYQNYFPFYRHYLRLYQPTIKFSFSVMHQSPLILQLSIDICSISSKTKQ